MPECKSNRSETKHIGKEHVRAGNHVVLLCAFRVGLHLCACVCVCVCVCVSVCVFMQRAESQALSQASQKIRKAQQLHDLTALRKEKGSEAEHTPSQTCFGNTDGSRPQQIS